MFKDSSLHFSNILKKILSKNNRIYLSFIGDLPFPVLLCDSSNLIRFVNREANNYFSYVPEGIIDAPVKRILNSPSGERISAQILKIFKSKKDKTFELTISGKNGKKLDLVIYARYAQSIDTIPMLELYFKTVSLPIPDTEPSGVLKTLSNIQTLGNFGYWELDKERTLFKASNECFKLLGVISSVKSINYLDFLSFLSRKEDMENIERGLIAIENSNQVFQADFKLKKRLSINPETRFIRLIAAWSNARKNVGYYGIIQDITLNKKLEKELLNSKEKADRANRLKTIFLTNLSYEIRTPMNAILGFAELLNMEDLKKEQKLEYTKVIRTKGNNLLSLIDDGIELSKFEAGEVNINKTEFELSPLLKELFNEFESKRIKLGKNNISLQISNSEENQHEVIYTDPGRLHQLLSNLLSNALKFTEKGQVEFGYKKSGKFFKFFVKDTGIGIDPENQSLIFNRFQEIDETATKKYSGGGLNLTISKHIVQLLGGKIKLKSELNKGSRFQINLPAESPKRKPINTTEFDNPNSINWKDKVILIAEDEDVNYKFLDAVLQKTQAQVLRAKTGREAVELCENISKIDLVLMDIKMPLMNGFEATVELKKIRPLLPVIALTTFSTQEELFKCQESGCDDIITKPIDIRLLLKKISNLL